MTACASCYARLRTANHKVRNEPEEPPARRADHRQALRRQRRGAPRARRAGESFRPGRDPREGAPAAGRAAGGLLLRLPADASAGGRRLRRCRSTRRAWTTLVAAAGAEPVDWPFKTECCGASLSMTQCRRGQPAGPPAAVHGAAGRGRVHRGGLSLVPGESRPASGRRGEGPRRIPADAGPLHHAASRAGLGAFAEESGARRPDGQRRCVVWRIADAGASGRRGREDHDPRAKAQPHRRAASSANGNGDGDRAGRSGAGLRRRRRRHSGLAGPLGGRIPRLPGRREPDASAAAWPGSTRPFPPATAPPASSRRSWSSACATTTSTC